MELIEAIIEKSNEAVPHLRKVVQDREYWEASDEKQWMLLHAVKLLGTIANPEGLPELINALPLKKILQFQESLYPYLILARCKGEKPFHSPVLKILLFIDMNRFKLYR